MPKQPTVILDIRKVIEQLGLDMTEVKAAMDQEKREPLLKEA